MEYQNLLFEKSNGIGILTINRPKVLNALNIATIEELNIFCEEVSNDKSVKVVIITGAGDKAFAAGADIAEMSSMSAVEARALSKRGQFVLSRLENLSIPVIAAVNGFALGGGCELAMACDIRIASEKAKFGQPEVSLGIPAGYGGTQRLARLVGIGVAKELLFTGDTINAQEAFRIGLLNRVVPADELLKVCNEIAEKIIGRAEVAVQLTKSAVNHGMDVDLASGMAYEAEVFGICFATYDQKEGMAAFLEKRKAGFTGK